MARKTTRKRRKKNNTLSNRFKKWRRKKKAAIRAWFSRHKLRFIIIGLALIAILGIWLYDRLMPVQKLEDDSSYIHNERFEDYLVVDGVDVSYAQGGDINFRKLKKAGVDFVFVRAGYRASADGSLHEDEFYKDNLKKAHKAGMMVGAYFFSQAINKKEAAAEARYLVELVDGYDIDLPLVMDYETYADGRLANAIRGGLSTRTLSNSALAFATEVEKAGYDSMIYANKSFLTDNLAGGDLSNYTNIWVAQYHNECQFKHNYNFWQCSDSLKVAGINGSVDRNFWYVKTGDNIAMGPDDENRKAIGECTIVMKDHNPKYWGKPVEPGVIVTDGRKLREGLDYTVGYAKNSGSGTGYAIITGIGAYKDKYAISFRIR